MTSDSQNTCGQCAQFRQSDGYCRKKGYVNAIAPAPAKCFVSRDGGTEPLAPAERLRKPRARKERKVVITKRCPKCGLEKPAEDFDRREKSPDGLQTYCRECHRKMQGKKPTLISKEDREQAAAATLAAGQKTCRCCGQTKPLSEFPTNLSSIDGLSHICRDCKAEKVSQGMRKRRMEREKISALVEQSRNEVPFTPKEAIPAPPKNKPTKPEIPMKPTKVYYERCINLGNYENEKIGIEIELEDGDTVNAAVDTARKRLAILTRQEEPERERYQHIVDNPEGYMYAQVAAAKKWLEEHPEPTENDLQF